ncbi:MAG: energy transducer TonB [Bacteroidales bacterium]|nr:energy transducer TonB [Bacteroidales bacterium]
MYLWHKLPSQRMFIDESVFRNKSYGAYVLRKKYYQYTIIALLISIVIFITIFTLPLLIQLNKHIKIEHVKLKPTQIPMELLDIPIDELLKQNEQLPEQKSQKLIEQLPEQEQYPEPTVIISDSTKKSTPDSSLANSKNEIYKQEEEGIFECGSNMLNFRMWFSQNFKYPINEKIRKSEGRAIAVFLVNEEGYVDSVNIVSGIDPLIDSAIKETLLTSPRWKPCIVNGKRVKQLYHFPIYLVRKI